MSESGSVRSSLRQRPRVRYDTLGSFEGVDLGDDDELRRLRPMSSSDEDEGAPGLEDDGSAGFKRKGKGKTKETASKRGRGGSGGGRSGAGRSRDMPSESEFELDEDADNGGHDDELDPDAVDEDSGGEGVDDEYDDDIVDFGEGKSARKNARKGGPSGSGKTSRGAPIEDNSDEDALLAAQFSQKHKLVKDSKRDPAAQNITQFGGAIAKAFKQGNWRVLVQNTLPLHPTGQTYLRSPPDLSKFSDVWIADTENLPKGRGWSDVQGVAMLHGHWTKVPLEIPWNWWAGQGWWPDCYYAYEDEGNDHTRMGNHEKGQRKRRKIDWKEEKPQDHWKQKVDVKLDLDQVGRYELGSLQHLTIAEAQEYIPIREHNPEPTLIIGLRTEEDEGADQDPPEAYKFQALQAMQFRGGSMRQCQVFDAGQFVSGMDWCPMSEEDSAKRGFRQYLAVSTMTPAPVDDLSHPTNKPRGCIQIWSLTPRSPEEREMAKAQMPVEALEDYQEAYDADMVCEMVVCIEGSEVRELKWLPFSCCDEASEVSGETASVPKIGIISALLCSGELAFYAIPDPEVIRTTKPNESSIYLPFTSFIRLEPLLLLQLEDAVGLSFDWGSSDRVAIGYHNGTIGVWDDVTSLLRLSSVDSPPQKDAPPQHFFHAHPSAVTTLTWMRFPVSDTRGNLLLDQPPVYLLSGGVDPTIVLHDLRDKSAEVFVDRYIRFPSLTTWCPAIDFPIAQDSEHILQFVRLRQISSYSTHRLFAQQGPIKVTKLCKSIACSDYHGLVAAGSVDGCVTWINALRSATRARKARVAQQTLYKLDYSRVSGLYRMVDGFAPEIPNHAARIYSQAVDAPEPKKKLTAEDWRTVSAGFPVDVHITRTVWQNGGGLGRAGILASGSGSGICRIDFINGYLYRGYKQSLPEDLGLVDRTATVKDKRKDADVDMRSAAEHDEQDAEDMLEADNSMEAQAQQDDVEMSEPTHKAD
ncbi:hypothetical protein QFC19_008434 [Naganishia cerealis]|uniref:Uncharacterized protein n=1 Tax=Naganishia cerealis TaxID=610337 RepID=A0ACC2V2C1_9TREE|nr:hypothetical protein QFC19_008434 [Naganishia cerealis]